MDALERLYLHNRHSRVGGNPAGRRLLAERTFLRTQDCVRLDSRLRGNDGVGLGGAFCHGR
jgi:hypothetical protein